MWVILNPAKAHRFTTKGINLHKSSPTAFVDPNLENEYIAVINEAIAKGKLIRIADNELKKVSIPRQASMDEINQEDTSKAVSLEHQRDENGKIIANVIVMPDEDGNVKDKEVKKSGVILTGITDKPLDEDEEVA